MQISSSCVTDPSIAQLVERWTVVVLTSIGRWFESGSKDTYFCHFLCTHAIRFMLKCPYCRVGFGILYVFIACMELHKRRQLCISGKY